MATPTVTDISDIDPISLSGLTLGELDFFERRAGISIADLGEDGKPLAGPLMVLVGIVLFRSGKYATPSEAQDAAQGVPMDLAQRLIDLEGTSTGE